MWSRGLVPARKRDQGDGDQSRIRQTVPAAQQTDSQLEVDFVAILSLLSYPCPPYANLCRRRNEAGRMGDEDISMWRYGAALAVVVAAASTGGPLRADEAAACQAKIEAALQRYAEAAFADHNQLMARIHKLEAKAQNLAPACAQHPFADTLPSAERQSVEPIRHLRDELEKLKQRNPRQADFDYSLQLLAQIEATRDQELHKVVLDTLATAHQTAAGIVKTGCRIASSEQFVLPVLKTAAQATTQAQANYQGVDRQIKEMQSDLLRQITSYVTQLTRRRV